MDPQQATRRFCLIPIRAKLALGLSALLGIVIFLVLSADPVASKKLVTVNRPAEIPTTFSKLTPISGTVNVANPVTLRWEAVAGATDGYGYCIDTTTDTGDNRLGATCDAGIDTGYVRISGTSVTLWLIPGKQYQWQVRAYNKDGYRAANDNLAVTWFTFTTSADPLPTPTATAMPSGNLPAAFTKRSPLNNETSVPSPVTLSWAKSVGATEYGYCIDTTLDGQCDRGLYESGHVRLKGENVTLRLLPGFTYQWQVHAYNQQGMTISDSGWHTFTVSTLPIGFSKLSPVNGATNVSTPATLQWEVSNRAIYGYCLEAITDRVPAAPCQVGGATYVATGSVPGAVRSLEVHKSYAWQAVATNASGHMLANGDWYTFTVTSSTDDITVIPGDIIGATPGDGSNPLCCIQGYVYLNGKPVSNPTVTIRTAQDQTIPVALKSSGQYSYFYSALTYANLNLGVGDTITLTAQANGLKQTMPYAIKASVQQVDLVLVSPTGYTRPVATMNQRSHSSTIDIHDTLVIDGMGQDSDNTPGITGYKWFLDQKPEPIGLSATLRISAAQLLGPGLHTISLTVQDEEGEWSPPVKYLLRVLEGWTLLLYLAGDQSDQRVNSRFSFIIGELEALPLPPHVQIALLRDAPDDGPPTTLLLSGNGKRQVVNPLFTSEVSMNDPATLTAFVRWGQQQFPNTHYYLAIADHGNAVAGIAWDETSPASNNNPTRPIYLRSSEIDDAITQEEMQKLDILHLDACSMNTIETVYELRNTADLLIASQYLAWNVFPYHRYVNGLQSQTSARHFAQHIAQTYAISIENLDGKFPYTISVLDLQRADAAYQAINDLSQELIRQIDAGNLHSNDLKAIRESSQLLEGGTTPPTYTLNSTEDFYLDLVDWSEELLKKAKTQAATQAVVNKTEQLIQAITGGPTPLIIHNIAVSGDMLPEYGSSEIKLEKANGVSIYYPAEFLFRQYNAFEFTQSSYWSGFLTGVGVLSQPPSSDFTAAPLAPLESPNTQGIHLFLPIVQR